MSQAERYLENHEDLEGEVEVLESPEYTSRGFIFPDGSVIAIGAYEDHRIVDIEDWARYHMVTYGCSGRELFARVQGYITWQQAEGLMSLCRSCDCMEIYIDVYDMNDRRVGDVEFDFPPYSAREIEARVDELLEE